MRRFRNVIAWMLVLAFIFAPLLKTEASAKISTAVSIEVLAEERDGYLTLEEAGALLRQYLVARRSDEMVIKFHLENDQYLSVSQVMDILLVEAIRHTGVGTEGDVLRWCYHSVGYGVEDDFDGKNHYITLTMQGAEYYASAEEEQELEARVEQILELLDLEGKSDYEKIFSIYDYVCKNVKYAEAIMEDGIDGTAPPPEYFKYYSIYGALVLGEATCQGFCNAMYRLLLEAGIDNRIISGDNHGWNIVKLGDLYYCLDATWDSDVYHYGDGNYQWFLKGASDFWDLGHTTDPYCAKQEFMDQYPISALNYGAEATATASGTCGENLTWTLTEDGTLTICGTGDMQDLPTQLQPWKPYRGYIKKVVIESGVTGIGAEAFYACQELTSVSIPDTVTRIGENAFSLCTKLREIVIPDSVTALEAGAFLGCWRLQDVTLSKNLAEISFALFMNCIDLKTVVIPDSVKMIDDQAFANCIGLTHVTIPDSVTKIGNAVFVSAFDPDAKASVVIPASVTEVGYKVFSWSGVYEVIWNAQTTKLDAWAFYLCHNLNKVTLSDSITEFGESVFQECNNLQTVKMPAALQTVGEWTFLDCTNLQNIELPGTLDELSVCMFSGCKSLKQIQLPEHIAVIPVHAFSGTGLTSIDLDGITEIGYGAFAGTALQEVEIPESVVSIGGSAFSMCKDLEKVVFMGNAPRNFGEGQPGSVFSTFAERDLTIYYPDGDPTWTEDILNDLLGSAWLKVCAYDIVDGHRMALQWVSDDANHWYVCMDCDHKESVTAHTYDHNCDVDCNDCGHIRGITHVYERKYNEDFHWWECACGDFVDEQIHVFDDFCDESCSECDYIREPFHSFYNLKKDATHHWYECDCGAKDRVEEHYGDGEVCDGCGEMFNHTHELVNWYWDEDYHWFGCPCGYQTEPEEHAWVGGSCAVCDMPAPDPVAEFGDVNGDGWIDVEDAMLILQYDAFIIDESDLDLNAADVSGDGWIDVEDAMLILQYDAFLIDQFPRGA